MKRAIQSVAIASVLIAMALHVCNAQVLVLPDPALFPVNKRSSSSVSPSTNHYRISSTSLRISSRSVRISDTGYDYSQITNGLVALWHMDETNGVRYDSTSNHFDLQENTNLVNSSSGLIGNAIVLGTNSYFFTTNEVPFTVPLSIAMWIKIDSTNQSSSFVIWATNTAWYMPSDLETNTFLSTITSGDAIPVVTIPFPGTNSWMFLCGRSDGLTTSFSVNLTNSTIAFGTVDGPLNSLVFGGIAPGGPTDYFSGMIDEVAIWSRRITDYEVNYLYNSGAGRYINP